MESEKVIIVEGGSDRKRVLAVLSEPVTILCTNGTVSSYRLEEMLCSYEDCDLYVFVDADESGEKIRSLFIREYPEAIHLYTEKVFREVETTPYKTLAGILLSAGFQVKTQFYS